MLFNPAGLIKNKPLIANYLQSNQWSIINDQSFIMARKLRVTGFTRFMLVMVILIPLAFAAAAIYNGKDPIAEAKRLLGLEATTQVETNRSPAKDTAPPATINDDTTESTATPQNLDAQLRDMMSRIEKLERDKMELEEQVKNQAIEIKELRRQLSTQN